ncbi:Beta-galactosidase 5 isoform 1 [Hibiscus syriacus]|uniref:Beta-galactosidase 5 isoform 1 n=1 Tax=Hibiscus syriacus TaxID=106335 RepID=A0A6A2WX97_HIBSY|nr:Beta-galactosidase 5 isoform 1 [Hibiscus syriacus]
MYAKCGSFADARKVFDKMSEKNLYTWSAMIGAYTESRGKKVVELFFLMMEDGVLPDEFCFREFCKLVRIVPFMQSGDLSSARSFFDYMNERDRVTWNSMLLAYCQKGDSDEAYRLFNGMRESSRVIPDVFTWTSMISGLAQMCSFCLCFLKVLRMGLEIHSTALRMGLTENVLVGNSLIDMICQSGYCGKAYELFIKMQESDVKPNVITWNTMISGYIQNGDEDRAMDLFQRIERDGKIRRNTASWNALIAGFVQLEAIDKAFGVFRKMQSCSISPNSVTILSILPGCANLVAAKKVKEIHGCILRRNLEFVLSILNSLIDTYAKSGGYVLHGCSDAALDLFNQMGKLGLKPNRGTFLSIILAHGIAKMVEEGKHVFSSIIDKYEVIPAIEHYSAMIELYGRSGRLGEAMEFIEDMPVEPDSSVWTSVLTASRIHKDIALSVLAGEQLLDLEPGNVVVNQLMFQIYSLCGKLDDSSKLRKLGKENTLRRSLGHSWIEVRNTVHKFATADRSKPCSNLLYSWVKNIVREVNIDDHHGGFFIEEEEKEDTGGVHSEKLALAFALIGSPSSPQIIRIVKNTRMCKNCHLTAKHVSLKFGNDLHRFVISKCKETLLETTAIFSMLEDTCKIGLFSSSLQVSCTNTKGRRVQSWLPPPADCYKINVDGAVRKDGLAGGIGGILRGSNSSILASFSESVGPDPPPLAELKGIKKGIEIFLSSVWAHKGRLIVESDCKSAVDWILSPITAPSLFSSLVKEIVSLILARAFIVRLIPRGCNWEADKLAKEGIG